ncbi:Zinc finger protein 2-like protein, partial [Operophtera brumata]
MDLDLVVFSRNPLKESFFHKIMAEGLDLKTVVKHLANGSLGDNLCGVCLLPLTGDDYENIFTSICKKDEEYCVADILREILDTEHCNICCTCFNLASAAYKFYLQAKRSYEILNFYTDQLASNIEDLDIAQEDGKRLLCIPLPVYTPETPAFDYGFEGIGFRTMGDNIETDEDGINIVSVNKVEDDEAIVIVRDGKSVSYRIQNGALQEIDDSSDESDDENVLMIVNEKKRKKREPMEDISCMHCPVKYRFLSKLKNHVKKICKLITDNINSYEEHLATHIGEYQCTQCHAVYRRQESLRAHMKSHEARDKCQQDNMANGKICEICGVVLAHETALAAHCAKRHAARHTCYYCGRTNKQLRNPDTKSEVEENEAGDSDTRSICGVCGKSFVDERSLLWHQRLHDNDRPFVCNHAVCAHTKPRRRCPLCPALFHLRSMVNTHLKKVYQPACTLCAHTPSRGAAVRCAPRCSTCAPWPTRISRRYINQHAMCAHTKPRRRCPLCPALFHLRSMVNTHLKKVYQPARGVRAHQAAAPLCPALFHLRSMVNTHLKKVYQPARGVRAHQAAAPLCPALFHLRSMKRRNRVAKHTNVFWRTETVPIQELSVAIQDKVLEIQSTQDKHWVRARELCRETHERVLEDGDGAHPGAERGHTGRGAGDADHAGQAL